MVSSKSEQKTGNSLPENSPIITNAWCKQHGEILRLFYHGSLDVKMQLFEQILFFYTSLTEGQSADFKAWIKALEISSKAASKLDKENAQFRVAVESARVGFEDSKKAVDAQKAALAANILTAEGRTEAIEELKKSVEKSEVARSEFSRAVKRRSSPLEALSKTFEADSKASDKRGPVMGEFAEAIQGKRKAIDTGRDLTKNLSKGGKKRAEDVKRKRAANGESSKEDKRKKIIQVADGLQKQGVNRPHLVGKIAEKTEYEIDYISKTIRGLYPKRA